MKNRNNKTMENLSFPGLVAPIFTPFNEDFSLNLDIIPDYANYLAEAGIKGVLVNGTSGEGMSLSIAERKQITEKWAETVGVLDHLMVQVGGAPLPEVLDLAKHASENGAHSLLCLPDLYNKPKNSNELIRYLRLVADAAPDTPLFYYHIPSFTNVNIHMGQFLNALDDEIPTFRGIKFTSTALDEGIEAVKARDGNYIVYLGADQLMAAAYTLGFDSAIATTLNIFPKLAIDILKQIQDSDINEARASQNILSNICSVITEHGSWVPTMKVALNLLTPINVGLARDPLINITEEEMKEMKEKLQPLI